MSKPITFLFLIGCEIVDSDSNAVVSLFANMPNEKQMPIYGGVRLTIEAPISTFDHFNIYGTNVEIGLYEINNEFAYIDIDVTGEIGIFSHLTIKAVTNNVQDSNKSS